jgi:hypothetical protein
MEADADLRRPSAPSSSGHARQCRRQAMTSLGVFGHEDMTVAVSGQGELIYGAEQVIGVARMIASHGLNWVRGR